MSEDLSKAWCDDDGRPVPGAPLLAAHRLWTMGRAADGLRDETASALGITRDEFDAACDFHAAMTSESGGAPLKICTGVSCRFEGAEAFHERLQAAFAASGTPLHCVPVHCLDQCLEGPNVRIDQGLTESGRSAGSPRTFCSKSCQVVVDERTWRPPEAGPRPVNDPDAPPVLA